MAMKEAQTTPPRKVDIITIGEELVEGLRDNTHLRLLGARLQAAGFRVRRMLVVRDDFESVNTAIADGRRGADIVITTGGLGPNEDDVTREAAARALGVTLVKSPEAEATLRDWLAKQGRETLPGDLRQARVFEGGRLLRNTKGSAPGLAYERDGAPLYLLPGPPVEMQAMLESEVIPALTARHRETAPRGKILRTHGVRAATLDARLRPLIPQGVKLTFGTQAGMVDVRLTSEKGADPHGFDALVERIRKLLGEDCFGDDEDTPAHAVIRALTSAGATVALAESCTGGLLGAALTAVPGASGAVCGGILAYADTAKRDLLDVPWSLISTHGAVSEPVARAMAHGAAARFGTDYALATTGYAGPAGGTAADPVGTVYVGLYARGEVAVVRLRLAGDRSQIRERAVTAALDWLRRRVGADTTGD